VQLPFTFVVEPPTRANFERIGPVLVGRGDRRRLIIAGIAVVIFTSPLPWRLPDPSAALDVTSVPDGATVDVDGRVKGPTPRCSPVAGVHHVTLRRDGYAEASFRHHAERGADDVARDGTLASVPGGRRAPAPITRARPSRAPTSSVMVASPSR